MLAGGPIIRSTNISVCMVWTRWAVLENSCRDCCSLDTFWQIDTLAKQEFHKLLASLRQSIFCGLCIIVGSQRGTGIPPRLVKDFHLHVDFDVRSYRKGELMNGLLCSRSFFCVEICTVGKNPGWRDSIREVIFQKFYLSGCVNVEEGGEKLKEREA